MEKLTGIALYLCTCGELIDGIRRKLDININVMCSELNMSPTTYTKLERGAA